MRRPSPSHPRSRPGLRRLRRLWPTGLVLLVWLAASHTAFWRSAEATLLDLWFALRGPVDASGQVVLLVLDQPAIAMLGGWPPSRADLARMIERLDEAGARAIVFDLLLSEPARPLREPEAGEAGVGGAPAPDRYVLRGDRDGRLVAAMQAAGTVVLPYAFVFDPEAAAAPGLPDSYYRAAYAVVRQPPGGADPAVPAPAGVLGPPEALAAAAAALGHVTAIVEPDGSLRSDRVALGFDGLFFPSLATEIARLHLGLPREAVRLDLGGRLVLGRRPVPVDERLTLWINFRGGLDALPRLDARQVLAPPEAVPQNGSDAAADTLRQRVAGRTVLIGAHAAGLGDVHRTPYAPQLPGVAVLGMAADTMIRGDAIERPAWREVATVLAVLALGGGVAVVWAVAGTRRRGLALAVALAASAGLLLGWLAAVHAAFAIERLWLDAWAPLLAGLAQTGHGLAGLVAGDRRARLAAQAEVEDLATRVGRARQAAGSAEGPVLATVMFADLVGYSSYAESAPPDAVLALVRAFQASVSEAVVATGGLVENYMGDGAMACFGIGEAGPAPAAAAIEAARRLLGRWSEAKADPAGAGARWPAVAIGIHTGYVMTGDVGDRHLTRFTLVGDAVNQASRMERACREQGCGVVVTEAVAEAARAAGRPESLDGFVALGPIAVPGRDGTVGAWGLPISASAAQPPTD